MLFLQISSLCIALATMFFGAMHSRWLLTDWWPPAASIWSSSIHAIHDERRESPSIRAFSSSPPRDGEPRLCYVCKMDPTRTVEDLASTHTGAYSTGYMVIPTAVVAFVMALCFLDWFKANYRPRTTKRRVSKVRSNVRGLKIANPSTSSTYQANSTTPERGRRLHRRSFRPVNSLINRNNQDDDSFTGPVEVKRWIIKDDSAPVRVNGYRPYPSDPDSGRGPNSILLPELVEAVSPVNTGANEPLRPVLFGEILQNQSQLTELSNDLQDIILEPLKPASPASNTSSNEKEAESPTALFEETIAWSRRVQRVEYRCEERGECSQPPPSTSPDAVSLTQTAEGSTEGLAFLDNATTASSKNPESVERRHCQHLAEKFKELESYLPSTSSESSITGVPNSSTGSNVSTKNEDTNMIFAFELDATTPSKSASPPTSSSVGKLTPPSLSHTSSPPFGGFQDANGHWNIDQTSTLPFGANSSKKRRTRHRPRKGRGRRRDRGTGEAEAEVKAGGREKRAV